jgi:hypothetical protein
MKSQISGQEYCQRWFNGKIGNVWKINKIQKSLIEIMKSRKKRNVWKSEENWELREN